MNYGNESIVTVKQYEASPNGVECTFVRVGNAGMKLYTDKVKRDRSFQLQQFFHANGLAPEAWFCFEFMGPNGRMLYAFYSDVVDVWVTTKDRGCDARMRWSQDAGKLRRKAQTLGVDWTDDHIGNIGYDRNGNAVIIDFGYMSAEWLDD